MMRWIIVLNVIFGFASAGFCWAGEWETNLNAGSNSVTAGVHYKKDHNNGYVKTGLSGLYNDDGDKEYKWAKIKFAVGNDKMQPGLTLEVGVDGIVGDAEDNGFSGDVGALAFSGYAGYIFPKHIMPVPIEVYGGLSYAPEMLSFRDTEDFLSYRVGIGVHVVRNATVSLEYNAYDVDMEAGPGPWNLDDDTLRLALRMRF